jgi:hypothetical protein
MRIENALRAFGLTHSSSIQELNRAYQVLIHRYRPERFPERRVWARGMIDRINYAYDLILDHLAARVYEEIVAELDAVIDQHDRFTEGLNTILEVVLDGVYIYYQYGLENIHRRKEGIWRLRYRGALRRVETALEHLNRLQPPSEPDADTLAACVGFTSAFHQNMRISKLHIPGAPRTDTEAYRHYRNGSEHLDLVIKRTLFPAELTTPASRSAPHAARVSHDEFMNVLIHHRAGQWVAEAAIKLYLLEALGVMVQKSERLPALPQDR